MEYQDRLITTTPDALVIRHYTLLLRTKVIPYAQITGVRASQAGWVNCRLRLWGTTLPGYWLNLDLTRPRRKVALVIDGPTQVKPVITPRDPDALIAALREHGVTVSGG